MEKSLRYWNGTQFAMGRKWSNQLFYASAFRANWSYQAKNSASMLTWLLLFYWPLLISSSQLYQAILNVLSFCMATVGARFTDRLGRRPVLLIATSLFVCIWSVVTALTALYGKKTNTNEAGSRAAISFIYLFGITYSFAYTPLQALYPVECLAYETRAKGN